jgi:hypothetical protein
VLQIATELLRTIRRNMDKRFTGALSISGAMEFLGDIGKTKMYELIKRGEISVIRIDTKPVILVSELENFLARISEDSYDGRKTS